MLCGDVKLCLHNTHKDFYWCKYCSAGISKLFYEEGAMLYCFCCGHKLSTRAFNYKRKEMKVYY